jgi:hypothetical protein
MKKKWEIYLIQIKSITKDKKSQALFIYHLFCKNKEMINQRNIKMHTFLILK